MGASFFQQFAVFDAARAGGLTSSAPKAQVEMPHRGVAQRQAAFLDRAHQINAPAGRIIFVSGLQISGTRGQAESAMDAGQGFGLVKERLGLGGVGCHGIPHPASESQNLFTFISWMVIH